MFSKYFIGNSYINPLIKPGESSLTLINVTFEPGSRNNWHIHHSKNGGGQILLCTTGEGWFQIEGKKPVSLTEGSYVYIPVEVKHWHGAKVDSWFSHISVEIPGTDCSNEWLEPVSDEEYKKLKSKEKNNNLAERTGKNSKYKTKDEFKKNNMFGTGMKNFLLSKHFSGRSYIKMLTKPWKRTPIFMSNVTFEPGCVNNWHIHHASQGGGQILICTAGEGWYQEEGKDVVSLQEGSVVNIPAEVKHWHGAKADSWFSHIALLIPGENTKNEWFEAISEDDYKALTE